MGKKLKFTILITKRSLSEKLVKSLKEKGHNDYFLFYAKGSASSTILEYLGIGETEKDVIIYPGGEKKSIELMEYIKNSEFIKSTLAFRVPVAGISSLKSLEYYLKEETNNE